MGDAAAAEGAGEPEAAGAPGEAVPDDAGAPDAAVPEEDGAGVLLEEGEPALDVATAPAGSLQPASATAPRSPSDAARRSTHASRHPPMK